MLVRGPLAERGPDRRTGHGRTVPSIAAGSCQHSDHADPNPPLEALAAQASATFWPAGAIQAGVAGVVGAVIAVVAWLLAIPVISWIGVVIGGFVVLMSVVTFVHEGRAALGRRRS